ncbi:hypothetical protein VTI74DRAFT_5547 [Chaetomium olivicolor]
MHLRINILWPTKKTSPESPFTRETDLDSEPARAKPVDVNMASVNGDGDIDMGVEGRPFSFFPALALLDRIDSKMSDVAAPSAACPEVVIADFAAVPTADAEMGGVVAGDFDADSAIDVSMELDGDANVFARVVDVDMIDKDTDSAVDVDEAMLDVGRADGARKAAAA